MKPSEALRAGMSQVLPHRGSYLSPYGTNHPVIKCVGCAIGALVVGAVGVQDALAIAESQHFTEAAHALVPDLSTHGFDCPADKDCWTNIGSKNPISYVVEHLFEDHKWSIPSIVEWLESIGH